MWTAQPASELRLKPAFSKKLTKRTVFEMSRFVHVTVVHCLAWEREVELQSAAILKLTKRWQNVSLCQH